MERNCLSAFYLASQDIELFHLFGFTDNLSWQPGNVTPVRPKNKGLNATRLHKKRKFNIDDERIIERFVKTFKSKGFVNGIF